MKTTKCSFDLKNLADHQKHLLIQKGVYTDELKAIWKRKWSLDYPYWTDYAGNLKNIKNGG